MIVTAISEHPALIYCFCFYIVLKFKFDEKIVGTFLCPPHQRLLDEKPVQYRYYYL